jgi:hypothetical protein
LADFVTGIASGYTEASGEPYQDMAYRIISGYFDDSYKVTRRLTIQFGLRLDHMGHWFDGQGTGMAAFFPNLVVVDEASGRSNLGVRYHGIDPGVAISGSPSRFPFASPRFGVAYDVFGDGKAVVSRRLGSVPLEQTGERLPGRARNLTVATDLQSARREKHASQPDW